jgi:hypothetical protein
MRSNAGKAVRDILRGKKGTIKDAELEPGSPSWDDIMDMFWEELSERASRREPGFQTFKKLLGQKRYDK